jgi:hypothetical protein
LLDAELCREALVHIDGRVAKTLEASGEVGILWVVEEVVIEDSGHAHAEERLFLRVLLPDLAEVGEIRESRLERSEDGRESNLALEVFDRVGGKDDDRAQVAELVGTQDDLACERNERRTRVRIEI